MKNKILITLVAFSSLLFYSMQALAQPKKVGESIKDKTYTDIDGNKFSLFQYLDEGYTLFIDISATWCGPCWQFHKTGTMQKLYELYGPDGTEDKGKIMPIFIEGDPSTTKSDLNGKTSGTQGDWVSGKDYHIVDVAAYADYISTFFQPGTTSLSFPTFFMVCPDKKIIHSAAGLSPSLTSSFVYNKYQTCEPTDISSHAYVNSIEVYPNPVTHNLKVDLNIVKDMNASLHITNLAGQSIYSENTKLTAGQQTLDVSVSHLAQGFYILSINTQEGNVIRQKFVKK